HDVTVRHNVPVWCGGMLESGVGRAHNMSLSTLDNFRLPGDVSASKRYWKEDIIEPEVEVRADGVIAVSDAPGTATGCAKTWCGSSPCARRRFAQESKVLPSRAKARIFPELDGTAEAVPFPKPARIGNSSAVGDGASPVSTRARHLWASLLAVGLSAMEASSFFNSSSAWANVR